MIISTMQTIECFFFLFHNKNTQKIRNSFQFSLQPYTLLLSSSLSIHSGPMSLFSLLFFEHARYTPGLLHLLLPPL